MKRKVKVEFEGISGGVEFDGKLCVHSNVFSFGSHWIKKEHVTILQPDFQEGDLVEYSEGDTYVKGRLAKFADDKMISIDDKVKVSGAFYTNPFLLPAKDVTLFESAGKKEEAEEVGFKYEVGDKLRGKFSGDDYIIVNRGLRDNKPTYKIFSFVDDCLWDETEYALDHLHEKTEEGEE